MRKVGEFVTIPEAARIYGVSRYALRRARELGELPVLDRGGWPKVKPVDVERWCSRRETMLPTIMQQRSASARFARSARS